MFKKGNKLVERPNKLGTMNDINIQDKKFSEIISKVGQPGKETQWEIINGSDMKKKLIYARNVKSTQTGGSLGIAVANVKAEEFSKKLSDVEIGDGANVFILDS